MRCTSAVLGLGLVLALAQKFTETMGRAFVVENIPGAGGVVAKGNPDMERFGVAVRKLNLQIK